MAYFPEDYVLLLDENISLNRNPGIVPFDVNLVGGLYINASYVNGYNNQNYIVTQGRFIRIILFNYVKYFKIHEAF